MTGQVRSLLESSLRLTISDAPELDALLAEIKRRFGEGLAGVLVYGSYIRGKRDTLLDFYILLRDHSAFTRRRDRWSSRLLPPSVLQISAEAGGEVVWAKCAAMTLAQFRRHTAHDFHSYFWARFAQPSRLAYAVDSNVKACVLDSIAASVYRFIERVGPLQAGNFTAQSLWVTGFSHTYRCEFRAEKASYIAALVDKNTPYYVALTQALAAEGKTQLSKASDVPDSYLYPVTSGARQRNRIAWFVRRVQGKLLSVVRLAKAALTFEAPLDYILWKIERHSGVAIEPTEKQRKYPLIFGWGLLWRAYRQGAVR